MAVSVVKKLERCEKMGRGTRQEEVNVIKGDNYHVVQYKLKIKDFSANQVKLIKFSETLREPLNSVAPQTLQHKPPELPPTFIPSSIILQHIHPQDLVLSSSSRSPLQLHQNLHQQELEYLNFTISPWKLQQHQLEHPAEFVPSPESSRTQPHPLIEDGEDMKTSQCKQKREEEEEENEEEEEEEELTSWAKSPWKLQENLQVQGNLEAMSESCKLHQSILQEEEEASWARSSLKLQKQEKKAGTKWEVEKMECECCGMEEECTRGYEERVRGELCGHWLCGLCGEAVREERKRLGGAGGVSMQAALAAHMQPCRGFSRRARSKASPPACDVAVPHAVCRLLRRHLSTPSPSARPPSYLSRSSSCLPKN